MPNSEFKLVSFDVCPFVQRSRIVLAEKHVSYDIEYIDLAAKPDWFLARVPTGRVPALFVGDETLFESAVINEFLDEVTEGTLLPSDPLARAKTRAWIAYAETLIMDQYRMVAAKNAKDFEDALDTYSDKLQRANDEAQAHLALGQFTLLDASIAPIFTRNAALPHVQEQLEMRLGKDSPILKWGEQLLARSSVQGSVPDDFDDLFKAFFKKRESFIISKSSSKSRGLGFFGRSSS